MANKKRYRFTETVRSKNGTRSCFLALTSFVLFLLDVILSFGFGGKAGSIAGVIALVAMLFAVYGFYLGMKSFSEQNQASSVRSVLGSITSGVMAVGWLTLFLTGLG